MSVNDRLLGQAWDREEVWAEVTPGYSLDMPHTGVVAEAASLVHAGSCRAVCELDL